MERPSLIRATPPQRDNGLSYSVRYGPCVNMAHKNVLATDVFHDIPAAYERFMGRSKDSTW